MVEYIKGSILTKFQDANARRCGVIDVQTSQMENSPASEQSIRQVPNLDEP
jgi:hypothetical protein